jgi:hypothetical protein
VTRVAERDLCTGAAALEGSASARVIHQHAPHHLRGDGEELGATLPARVVLAVESEPTLALATAVMRSPNAIQKPIGTIIFSRNIIPLR